ncbi:GNAT family N-acetyltransferase [Hymenobacter jeollabukensis]|uniref:GNAT family N-acetyltransferase n=1 Tax=Hymenobacter jeollabukensis TaxID=2025313 RepID=A0A5R8WMC5_9BACT|nr:GNAT family protein [Hymenobacter jeollabukensis]TLM90575.1 GNAT family N-acetyltransferase [Hymenobacter jeollabukensis]
MTLLPLLAPTPLRTARLLLRPYLLTDASAFFALLDAEAARLQPAFPRRVAAVRTYADAEQQLRLFTEQWRQRRLLVWGIWQLGTGQYLGDISLQPDSPRIRTGEIGYYLAAAAEGQGYAREALAAVVDFAFAMLHARQLTLRCRPDNQRSQATAEALGFQRTGIDEPGIWHYTLSRA